MTVNLQNQIVDINNEGCRALGYTRDELVGMSVDEIESEFDVPPPGTPSQLPLGGHVTLFGRHVRKDKTTFPVEMRASLIMLGGVPHRFVIIRDISERLEAERKQRMLSQQVVVAQEEERRRVSRELHDEAGQAMTALRYNLASVVDALSAESTPVDLDFVDTKLNQAIALNDETAAQLRHLAHRLRPAALDDLGLALAITGFCHEFAAYTGLEISFDSHDVAEVEDIAGITIYRVVQEGLNNVARYANATKARVDLNLIDDRIALTIVDNGEGFDVPANFEDDIDNGMGLTSMQERLDMIGGTLTINSEVGIGTSLLAELPGHLIRQDTSENKPEIT